VARLALGGRFIPREPEEDAWLAIAQAAPEKKLLPLLEEPGVPAL